MGTTRTRVPALSGPRAISRGCAELSPRKLARTGLIAVTHIYSSRITLESLRTPMAMATKWQRGQPYSREQHVPDPRQHLDRPARRPALRGVRFGNHAPAHGARAHPLGSRGLPRAGGGGASGRGRDRRGRGDSRPGSAELALRRLRKLQFGRASRQSARAAGTPRARAGRASGSGGIPSPAQFRARWPPDRRPSATAVRHFPILGKPRAATRGTRRRPRRGRSDCGG